MLIQFDPKKVRFQKVKIKRVSTALGGSISLLDEEHLQKTGKERFHTYDIPLSLARMFIVKHKISNFIVPHEGCVMWYDNQIVSVEKSQLNQRLVKTGIDNAYVEWTSTIEKHFNSIQHLFVNDEWYFDGLYVYQFSSKDLFKEISKGIPLDLTGKFRGVPVRSVHLTHLNLDLPKVEERFCISFFINKDTYSISPPIWKTLNTNALLVNDTDDRTEKTSLISSFHEIDNRISVNVNFALKAAKDIAEQFGYQYIQPLQLPELMLSLNTINLPSLPKEVKSTTAIGIEFTHCLAWLLGLLTKCQSLQQFLVVRQLIKYLLTKGYFWKKQVEKRKWFLTPDKVPPKLDIDLHNQSID